MDYQVIDWPGPEVTRFNTVICKGCGALVSDFYRAQHDDQPHALPDRATDEVTVNETLRAQIEKNRAHPENMGPRPTRRRAEKEDES